MSSLTRFSIFVVGCILGILGGMISSAWIGDLSYWAFWLVPLGVVIAALPPYGTKFERLNRKAKRKEHRSKVLAAKSARLYSESDVLRTYALVMKK